MNNNFCGQWHINIIARESDSETRTDLIKYLIKLKKESAQATALSYGVCVKTTSNDDTA